MAGGDAQPSETATTGARVDPRFLRVYVNDHLAVAEGISGLGRRVASAKRWRDQRADFERLARVLEDNRRALEEVLTSRGLKPDPLKSLLARGGELAGRLKGNGRLVRASPLNRMVEIDGLRLGVLACMTPWETLIALGLDTARAQAALETLRREAAFVEGLREPVTRSAFAD